MSQVSHQKMTCMGGRKKVTKIIQGTAQKIMSQECSYSTGWLSRHVKGHSQEATIAAIHGADSAIAEHMQGLRNHLAFYF